jgi:hypothetical protein
MTTSKGDHNSVCNCRAAIAKLAMLCLTLVGGVGPTSVHGQYAQFLRPTDAIQIQGQTVLNKAATFEAVLMYLLPMRTEGQIWNEWTNGLEDKNIAQHTNIMTGTAYNVAEDLLYHVSPAPYQWHHVAYVYDGAAQRLYLDGTLVLSSPASGAIGNGSGLPQIGAIYRDARLRTSFGGLLQSLRISNSARYSGTSVSVPMGDMANDSNTVMLFNFNEPAGSTTVADESSNHFTGILGAGFSGATAPGLGTLSAVAPTIGIKHAVNIVGITWTSTPSAIYLVQASDAVNSSVWNTISPPIYGTGGVTNFYTPATPLQQYFRVYVPNAQ